MVVGSQRAGQGGRKEMRTLAILLTVISLSSLAESQMKSVTAPALQTESETSSVDPVLTEEMVSSLPAVGDHVQTSKQSTVSVQVYSDNNHGFNQRLKKALERSFKSSPGFNLSRGKHGGLLISTIKSCTDWKSEGVESDYVVEFSSDRSETLGISVGSCLNEALAKCTSQILRDARTAAQFLSNSSLMRHRSIQVTIPVIKSDPLKYDGKLVQIAGLAHAGHRGMLLETDDRTTSIRLRSADLVGCPIPLQRSALYSEFWNISEGDDLDPDRKDIHVVLDGLVRVLKTNGKMADEFELYGQWPLEVIVTRIISMHR
jgi:hypothetical protein